ncbi:coagulation factor XI-like [Lissotriton helveticus]
MKSLLLLQAVLVWTSMRAEEQDFHVFIEDIDFTGNDVERATAPDDGYCQMMCSFHAHCTHFTYRPSSFDCFMKHVQDTHAIEERHQEGLVSGYAIPADQMHDYQCYPELFRGMEFPGHNVLILQRQTAEECQEACTLYEDCEFCTHDGLSKLCLLKSRTKLAGPTSIAMVHGVISGYTLKDCPPSHACDNECTDLVLDGVDFPGHDLDIVLSPDADRCQLVCNDLPLCQFFSFSNENCTDESQRFRCSLKAACTGMPSTVAATPNVQSGFSLRNVRSHKSCSYEVYVDMDFTGNDQKVVEVSSYRECQQQCTDDNLCQMWSFVSREYAKEELHGNCYLKNVLALPSPSRILRAEDHTVSAFSQKKCVEYIYESESYEVDSEEEPADHPDIQQ